MKKITTRLATQAEFAVRELSQAEKLERRPPLDKHEIVMNPPRARQAREDGERLMVPPDRLIGDARTELVPGFEPDEKFQPDRAHFLDTLAEPNTISVDASEHRTQMATRAGVLSTALDAALSAQLSPPPCGGAG